MKQIIFLALLVPLLVAGPTSAESEPGDNWELRVCADPQGLPFSDRETPGFENRIAEIFFGCFDRCIELVEQAIHIRNTVVDRTEIDFGMGVIDLPSGLCVHGGARYQKGDHQEK